MRCLNDLCIAPGKRRGNKDSDLVKWVSFKATPTNRVVCVDILASG